MKNNPMTHGQRVSHCESADLELSNYLSKWSEKWGLFNSEIVDILMIKAMGCNVYSMRHQRYGNTSKPDWNESIVLEEQI